MAMNMMKEANKIARRRLTLTLQNTSMTDIELGVLFMG